MAKVGAAAAGLKDELTCPICLCIYRDPLLLGCGHSFCKHCIQEAHRCQQGPYSCPLCHSLTCPAGELKANFHLRNIVQNFLDVPLTQEEKKQEAQCKEKEESLSQQEEMILCDVCIQAPQAAVKTCLNCEASLCQAHLRKHGTKNPQKSHILVEPCTAELLAKRKCPQHGKLLECYCTMDRVCICMLCCVLTSHKSHKIISLQEAFAQALKDFPKTLREVKKHEAALDQSIENLLKQEEEVKAEESLQRGQLESLFRGMHLQLENKKCEMLKALNDYEERQLSQIQMEIKKHKEQKNSASHDVRELEALRSQEDQLLFTRGFTEFQARKRNPVPNKDHVVLENPPITLDESRTDNALGLFKEFLSNMESSFKPAPGRGSHDSFSFWASSNGGVAAAAQPGGVSYGPQMNIVFQSGVSMSSSSSSVFGVNTSHPPFYISTYQNNRGYY